MNATIRFADADALKDPARFAQALSRVSAERRDRVMRLRDGAARRLSLAAGLPLAALLVQVLGSANAFLEFVRRSALSVELSREALLHQAREAAEDYVEPLCAPQARVWWPYPLCTLLGAALGYALGLMM